MEGNSAAAATSAASAALPASVPEDTERAVAEESATFTETTELLPAAYKG